MQTRAITWPAPYWLLLGAILIFLWAVEQQVGGPIAIEAFLNQHRQPQPLEESIFPSFSIPPIQ